MWWKIIFIKHKVCIQMLEHRKEYLNAEQKRISPNKFLDIWNLLLRIPCLEVYPIFNRITYSLHKNFPEFSIYFEYKHSFSLSRVGKNQVLSWRMLLYPTDGVLIDAFLSHEVLFIACSFECLSSSCSVQKFSCSNELKAIPQLLI